ncbi:MAG: acetyl-coenzyme A synthetase N-terminal domain-containing protein, partial [Bacteroidota bacterium]
MNEQIVWNPAEELIAKNRLHRFLQKHGLSSVDELLDKSSSDLEWYWNAVVQDLDWKFYKPFEQTLDTSKGIAWTRWFLGGKTNLALNAIDKHIQSGKSGSAALIWEGEDGKIITLSYLQLFRQTNQLANALRD